MPHTAATVHENSRAAFHSSAPMISKRQQLVLDWVMVHDLATDRQIMNGLGFADMNAVRPRVTELLAIGLLRECGWTICSVTGKRVRCVEFTPEQGSLFS